MMTTNPASPIAIEVKNISKSFRVGEQVVPVLKDISFQIKKKEFLVIFGPSGCGKSTLLHILLGLEPPTTGEVTVMAEKLYQLPEDQIANFRKKHIGMVYQQPHWISSLNVIENLAFPLTLMREPEDKRLAKASEMMNVLQMDRWAKYHPSELSSGQQQRISLGRAIISNPEIIIADEPTGNLDYESGVELMNLLKKIDEDTDKTILMVTHDLEYMKYADRAIRMLDGQVADDFGREDANAYIKSIRGKRNGHDLSD